jgi:hypothetical protein
MIDLHIHSIYSDGTNSIKEIFEIAKQLNLKQISITDHNCIDGSLEALKYLNQYSIDFVIGIELSCLYKNNEVHLLGYFSKDTKNFDSIYEFIKKETKYKEEAQIQMIEKLNKKGFQITNEELKLKNQGKSINRVHIARLMLEKGYVSSINEAFDLYIGEDCDCYVQKKCSSINQAIDVIHRSHGIAVLAHPYQYINHNMEEYLQDIINDIDGIEAIHSSHTLLQIEELKRIANNYHKIITGGSDYHGDNKPNIKMNCMKNEYYLDIERKTYENR